MPPLAARLEIDQARERPDTYPSLHDAHQATTKSRETFVRWTPQRTISNLTGIGREALGNGHRGVQLARRPSGEHLPFVHRLRWRLTPGSRLEKPHPVHPAPGQEQARVVVKPREARGVVALGDLARTARRLDAEREIEPQGEKREVVGAHRTGERDLEQHLAGPAEEGSTPGRWRFLAR